MTFQAWKMKFYYSMFFIPNISDYHPKKTAQTFVNKDLSWGILPSSLWISLARRLVRLWDLSNHHPSSILPSLSEHTSFGGATTGLPATSAVYPGYQAPILSSLLWDTFHTRLRNSRFSFLKAWSTESVDTRAQSARASTCLTSVSLPSATLPIYTRSRPFVLRPRAFVDRRTQKYNCFSV